MSRSAALAAVLSIWPFRPRAAHPAGPMEEAPAGEVDLVPLASPMGLALLARCERSAHDALLPVLAPQTHPAFCGVASAVGVLRAIGRAGTWFEAGADPVAVFFLAAEGIVDRGSASQRGLALADLGDVLRRVPSVAVTTHSAASLSDADFRRLASAAMAHSGQVIVNYSRRVLGQTGGGHFSPLGAYAKDADRFLILDVAPDRHPPAWVRTADLFAAMRNGKTSQGIARGFIVVMPAG